MGLKLPRVLRPIFKSVLAAVGVISLTWVYQRIQDSKADKSTASPDENRKKRPSSETSSPEQSKRARTAVPAPSNDNKGNVTDITALLASKVAIPDSDQDDPEKLGKHYAKMAFKFESGGLNLGAVEDAKKYFRLEGERAEPLDYLDFQTPLARGAVRLGVFRFSDEESDGLATSMFTATTEIAKVFPQGSVLHCIDKSHYHMTVQMISHPSNPRPDSGVPGGGFHPESSKQMIPSPSPSVLQKETLLYQKIASYSSGPELKVHSVVFADSGTLLLLFTDATGQVFKLRKALTQAFPGAVEKQSTIMHATLARLLTAKDLSAEQKEDIISACSTWTEKLRGKTVSPKALWHVQENTFTHIDDKSSRRFPLKE